MRTVVAAECLRCHTIQPVESFETIRDALGPTCAPCRQARVEPVDAIEMAKTIAESFARRARCRHLIDEFIGAALLAYAEFTFDPQRGTSATKQTALRMRYAMVDEWRRVYGRNANGRRAGANAAVSLDRELWWDDDRVGHDVTDRNAVDDIERFGDREAATDIVQRVRAAAQPTNRSTTGTRVQVMDMILEDPARRYGDIGAHLGMSGSAVSQALRDLRPLAVSVGAA